MNNENTTVSIDRVQFEYILKKEHCICCADEMYDDQIICDDCMKAIVENIDLVRDVILQRKYDDE